MLQIHSHSRRIRLQRPSGSLSRWIVWRRRAATLIAGALVVLMAYGVVFGHNGLTAFISKRRESQNLLMQTERLDRENIRLQGHVERLRSDPSAIEHQAREELHYTRAGEVIYTLPAAEAAAGTLNAEK